METNDLVNTTKNPTLRYTIIWWIFLAKKGKETNSIFRQKECIKGVCRGPKRRPPTSLCCFSPLPYQPLLFLLSSSSPVYALLIIQCTASSFLLAILLLSIKCILQLSYTILLWFDSSSPVYVLFCLSDYSSFIKRLCLHFLFTSFSVCSLYLPSSLY